MKFLSIKCIILRHNYLLIYKYNKIKCNQFTQLPYLHSYNSYKATNIVIVAKGTSILNLIMGVSTRFHKSPDPLEKEDMDPGTQA